MTQTSAIAQQGVDQTVEGPGDAVDLDRMWSDDGARRPRRLRRFVPVVVGIVVGMAAGAGIGLSTPPDPAATASVEILPDPNLSGGVLDSNQANRYVQGQVLVLGGDDMLSQAETASGVKALDLSVTQLGATDVVELKVVASTSEGATALTQALISGYRDGRQQAYANSVDASLKVVNAQLKAIQQTSTTAASRARTSAEYDRLLALRNSLQYNRDAAQLQVPVVQEPGPEKQSRYPAAARNAFVGLVLGGLLGLLVKLVVDRPRRKRPGRAQPDWS